MRFLRMLTNSVLAGLLGAAYLTVLVLQLNPDVALVSATTWRWFLTLGLFYGVHLAVVFYVLIVAREFVSMDALSPGWVSVRLLAWLAAVAAAAAAVLMWVNVRGFAAALDDNATRRMTAGAAATTASALVLFGLAGAHYSFGRRGSRVGAALLAIAVVGSLALPIAARGMGEPAPRVSAGRAGPGRTIAAAPRVTVLLLDGASLEYIWPRAVEGRLPNFARLLENGASLDLATVRPTGPDPVWTAVATGIYPERNGVRSPAVYYVRNDHRPIALLPDSCFSHALVHFGFVRREPNSPAAVRGRPIWSILADAGIPVGIGRWPLTYPAQPVNGFILSDRFHVLLGSMLELAETATYPAEALPIARNAFVGQEDGAGQLKPAGTAAQPLVQTTEASAAQRDRLYSRAMRDLRARWPVQFSALRYQGLDTVGHYYVQYAQPRGFGDLPEEERRRRLQLMDRYYGFIDSEIGNAIASLAPGDLLLVVSGFGMEPRNPVKQVLGLLLRDPMNGTHDRAPDGFLLAYGRDVEARRLQRGSIVDVTPTILYFLGLPIGRDMDGYARADLFKSAFTAGRPIAFIPTHNR